MRLTNSEIFSIFEKACSENKAFSVGLFYTTADIVYNVKLVFPIPNISIEGTAGEQSYGNFIDTLIIEGKEQKFSLESEDHAFIVMSAINKYLQKLGYVFVTFSPGDEDADFMLIKFSELSDYLDKGFLEV